MKWYNEKSDTFAAMTKRLRVIELILAAAATLITAIAGIAGKSILGIPFDAAAFTAVLTTLAGAVLAHVEASRYDFLVMANRATARRLESTKSVPAALVGFCERLREHPLGRKYVLDCEVDQVTCKAPHPTPFPRLEHRPLLIPPTPVEWLVSSMYPPTSFN